MKDLFSKQAKDYVRYRPSYPPELFEYIYSFVRGNQSAWDCATGNGQTAIQLAKHFKEVKASDISAAQIALAPPAHNVQYIICPAENTPFPDDSFDLITVSQAYHWFDWEAFRKEAKRVGKERAVIAVWMYDLLTTDDKDVNALIHDFYLNIVGPYWDAERRWMEEHYETIPFDFGPLPSRQFSIQKSLTLEELLGFFTSWSATQNYIQAKGHSPLDIIKERLDKAWHNNEARTFTFPVYLRMGSV